MDYIKLKFPDEYFYTCYVNYIDKNIFIFSGRKKKMLLLLDIVMKKQYYMIILIIVIKY